LCVSGWHVEESARHDEEEASGMMAVSFFLHSVFLLLKPYGSRGPIPSYCWTTGEYEAFVCVCAYGRSSFKKQAYTEPPKQTPHLKA